MGKKNALSAPKAEEDWQAEDDLRTLTRAEDVRGDSTRMAAVRRVHRKQLSAMSKVGRSFQGKR